MDKVTMAAFEARRYIEYLKEEIINCSSKDVSKHKVDYDVLECLEKLCVAEYETAELYLVVHMVRPLFQEAINLLIDRMMEYDERAACHNYGKPFSNHNSVK